MCRYSDLALECGRSPAQLSQMFKWGINHIHTKMPHLHDARSLECWGPMFPHFAAVIHRGGRGQGTRRSVFSGTPIRNCALLVDGSNQYLDRPGRYQSVLYNGHKRAHLVKGQGLMLPNGIMPYPFGPINGSRHDSYLLERSHLVPILSRICRRLGYAYCAFGDPAYPHGTYIQGPYPPPQSPMETIFNKQMSAVRIPQEWGFGKIKSLWSYLDFKKGQKPYQQDIGRYWVAAQILTNCHTCLYGSETASYFDCDPPSLRVYLSMGES